MVTNGPYTLETWDHDQQIVLARNQYYGGNRRPSSEPC